MDKQLEVARNQVLRGFVLKIADYAEPLGASVEVIYNALKKEDVMGYSKKDIRAAARYLEKKKLVELKVIKNDVLDIERYIVKVTAAGTDLLEGTITEDGIELV